MEARRLVVVSAGLSQPSSSRLLADRLAAAADRAMRSEGTEATIDVVELRGHAQDLASNLLTGFPSPGLKAAIDRVLAADGLVAVSPIFNASYSGLFKTFFDVIERDRLAGKVALIAATGGTARHSLALEHALRPLFSYLGAVVIPTAVFAAPEDWGRGDAAEPPLADRIERAARELAAAIVARPGHRVPDPFEDPVPFEQLLGGDRDR